jgi:hypothetical protein
MFEHTTMIYQTSLHAQAAPPHQSAEYDPVDSACRPHTDGRADGRREDQRRHMPLRTPLENGDVVTDHG